MSQSVSGILIKLRPADSFNLAILPRHIHYASVLHEISKHCSKRGRSETTNQLGCSVIYYQSQDALYWAIHSIGLVSYYQNYDALSCVIHKYMAYLVSCK